MFSQNVKHTFLIKKKYILGYANVGNIPFDHFETTVRTIYFLIVENVPLFECIKNVSSWLCERYRNVSFYPFENFMNVTFECSLNV